MSFIALTEVKQKKITNIIYKKVPGFDCIIGKILIEFPTKTPIYKSMYRHCRKWVKLL